jgi:hypothetical protein
VGKNPHQWGAIERQAEGGGWGQNTECSRTTTQVAAVQGNILWQGLWRIPCSSSELCTKNVI